MAQKKKKTEEEESKTKSTTHTTVSNTVKGGRGGSFGSAQTVKTKPKNIYLAAAPVTPQKTAENFQTARTIAKAQRGLQTYQKDLKKEQGTKSHFTSQASADAPKAVHDFYQAKDAYARDKSYQQIGRDWTMGDKLKFGYLYDEDPKTAKRYAAHLNDSISEKKALAGYRDISRDATRNLGSSLLHNGAALASSVLFSVPELLDNIAEFSARGRVTKKSYMTPMSYSRQVKTDTRNRLNGVDEEGVAQNVLDESIPILGGKGWGDLYDIGFGIAESWLSGNTLGRAYGTGGKIIRDAAVGASAFARTATSVIDSVGQTGADGKQAMALGVTMGLLDAAGIYCQLMI